MPTHMQTGCKEVRTGTQTTTRMVQLLAWIALTAILSSCGFTVRPSPVKNYYVLELPPQQVNQPPQYAFSLKVTNFEVSPPYQERGLVYRLEEQRYDSDFYNLFFATPRSMITTQATQWLGQRQIFTAVLSPVSTLDAPYLMEGLINQLYADLRPKTTPASVLTMQVFVTRAADRTIVLDRNYSHTVFIPNQSPGSIVKGMSEALEQCLVELERDLRALDLKP